VNNSRQIVISKRVQDTNSLALKLLKAIWKTKLLYLTGPLGSGKSTFTKALGMALGITTPITSPTFTLIKEYAIPKKKERFVHIDLYRILNQPQAINELSIESYIGENIVCIEWAKPVLQSFLNDSIHLDFRYDGEEKRIISIHFLKQLHEKKDSHRNSTNL